MLIRLLLLVVAIGFFRSLAHSDEPAFPRVDASRSLSHRRAGTTLTIMGIAHVVIGGALLVEMGVTSGACKATSGCMNEMGGVPQIVAGSLLASSGAVFAATGIPLWVGGARAASLEAGGARVVF
jgi:hypothetical protein